MIGKPRFERLLEPSQIGQVKTRNRIIKTAALMEYNIEQNKAFYEAIARGGAGLINVGSFDLAPIPVPYQLYIGDDKSLPGLAELTKAIHKHGCPTFLTMLHFGPRIPSSPDGPDVISASAFRPPHSIPEQKGVPPYSQPREITVEEIEELIEKFGDAAERAQKAGFDGVEISGATDHLINSFLSRAWNQRQDSYGCGSLENRARFMVEIIRNIKKRLGQDFPVGAFINGAEYGVENGTTSEESQDIARILEKAGADSIHLRAFGYGDYYYLMFNEQVFYPEPPGRLAEGLDGSNHGAGAFVPLAAAVKKVVSIPVITVGRLGPAMGEQILRKGKADFIGMTRRLIADPELPNKIASGRLEDIAPCTACMNCISTVMVYQGGSKCRINAAAASEEDYTIKPADIRKRVLVIGGGPAGMEAARVAALRGHEVILYERESRLGGLIPLAAMVKGTDIEDLPALARYLKTQITKLGVKIRLGKEVSKSTIEKIKPDAIIVATGGTPDVPEIPGINGRNVLSAEDLHRKARVYLRFLRPNALRWLTKFWMPVGKKVVILGGAMQGCELAEFLVKRGRNVTIVETAEEPGDGLATNQRFRLFNWFAKKGAVMISGAKYGEITDKGLTITNRQGERQTIKADSFITALPLTPASGILKDLGVKAPEIYYIGDCKEPGLIRTAIADGWRISRDI